MLKVVMGEWSGALESYTTRRSPPAESRGKCDEEHEVVQSVDSGFIFAG